MPGYPLLPDDVACARLSATLHRTAYRYCVRWGSSTPPPPPHFAQGGKLRLAEDISHVEFASLPLAKPGQPGGGQRAPRVTHALTSRLHPRQKPFELLMAIHTNRESVANRSFVFKNHVYRYNSLP